MNDLPFGLVKAVKGRGHEVVADPENRERALEPFDDGGPVFADLIDRFAKGHDLGAELAGAGEVSGFGCVVEIDVERLIQVRSAVDAATAAHEDDFAEELFGSDEKGPVGPGRFGEVAHFAEVDEVAGAVFETDDFFLIEGPGHDLAGEGGLCQGRHVVEHEGEGEFGKKLLDELAQLGLSGGKVEGRRGHDGVGSAVSRVAGEPGGLDEGGVGDADENGDATADETAGVLDEFTPKPVAETGGLAGGAEDEKPRDAAGDEALDVAFEAGEVEVSRPVSGVIMGGMMPW